MNKTALEICAGAGGQALGLEKAGFNMAAAVEIDREACKTLRMNRPDWLVLNSDVRHVEGREFRGIDLFAGGVPCPPFSTAGRQLGREDERDLFPEALRLIEASKPRAFMLENVRGFASRKFEDYRARLFNKFRKLGFEIDWKILTASEYGVPQLRPRFVLVGLKSKDFSNFRWPNIQSNIITVADAIGDQMSSGGWKGVGKWRVKANKIAPTLVGGSKKHGGPDLGPTRAKKEWRILGVDASGIAEAPPDSKFPTKGYPRLTVRMAARIQGFPDDWQFIGSKTACYRQVGNAFPPPVAEAVGRSIVDALDNNRIKKVREDRISALIGVSA